MAELVRAVNDLYETLAGYCPHRRACLQPGATVVTRYAKDFEAFGIPVLGYGEAAE
jgi:hypothetical protein